MKNNDLIYETIGKISNYGTNTSSIGYINIVKKMDFFCIDKSLTGASWTAFKNKLNSTREVINNFNNLTTLMYDLAQELALRLNNCVAMYSGRISIPSKIDYNSELINIDSIIKNLQNERNSLLQKLYTKTNGEVNKAINYTSIKTQIAAIDNKITDYQKYHDFVSNLRVIYTEYSDKFNQLKTLFRDVSEEFSKI